MDEDSVAGDLQVGGYASGEWAGKAVRPFLGFDELMREQMRREQSRRERWARERVDSPARGQVQTSEGVVRYISPDQLESWAAAEWDYDGDEAA